MYQETILVVDDNPDNLILIELLLASANYKVLTADSARDALEALSSSVPDAMLTDIQMPDVDGLELIRQVRLNPRTSAIPILAVSANALKENIQEAYAAGCDGYFTKPLDTQTFATSVREHLVLVRNRKTTCLTGAAATEETVFLHGDVLMVCVQQIEQLLNDRNNAFRREEACGILHQCAGTAGALGHPQITALARNLEMHSAALTEQEFMGGLHTLADLLAHLHLQADKRVK